MCIIHKLPKISHKKNIKIFALNIKMLNLLKTELRSTAKKRGIIATQLEQKLN